MKTRLFALLLGYLTLSAGAFAEDKPADGNKDAIVSELDAKKLRDVFPKFPEERLSLVLPIGAERLPKEFPNEEVRARLKKEVDFTKQQLLLIAWIGSSDDQLTYIVEKGEKGPVVTFQYQAGRVEKKEPDSKKEPEDPRNPKKKPTLQLRAFAVAKDVPCYTQGLPTGPDPFSIPKNATRPGGR